VGRRLSIVWLGVALLRATPAAALESDGFALETGSPDALCPELETTREIVARRLGSLVVEGHKGWLARYTIGHAPSGTPRDFIRLELFSPEGTVELLRDLPIEGASCRTMGEVIALVLDRYFRGLGEGDERPPESNAAVTPPANSDPSPVAPRLNGEQHIVLARRLSAEYVVTRPVAQSWLGFRASEALGKAVEAALALRVGLTPLEERAAEGASVEARTANARLGLAWRFSLPPGLLHLGGAVSLAVDHATTRGLVDPTDRTRVGWSAGAEAGFVAPLGRSLFCETSVFADFLGGSGHFLVGEREVLSPPRLTLGWSLGFGYAWPQ